VEAAGGAALEPVVVSAASIQVRVDLESVERGVARFGAGERAHRVAVLDVTGADQSLASADEAKQEELLAGRAQFLNAQLADFQLLVRAEPVDLTGHLGRVHERARGLPEPLAALAAVVRGQQVALALARLRGLDPDAPRGLSKVTPTH
jgi:glucosamine--fructose-6-phosphate aminotransferase (isomerizing)